MDTETYDAGVIYRSIPIFDDRRVEQDRRKFWRDKENQDRRDALEHKDIT